MVTYRDQNGLCLAGVDPTLPTVQLMAVPNLRWAICKGHYAVEAGQSANMTAPALWALDSLCRRDSDILAQQISQVDRHSMAS